jgi:transcriptional regulator with XRE-family HTH domain
VSIGARFLEIRKAKGLKQTDVAEAIGISHGALVNYEKGREPPASAILAFSQVYGVSANWLRPAKADLMLRAWTASMPVQSRPLGPS